MFGKAGSRFSGTYLVEECELDTLIRQGGVPFYSPVRSIGEQHLSGGVRHHQAELLADPGPPSGECDYTGKPFASLANHSQLR